MFAGFGSEIVVGVFTLTAALAGSYLQYHQNIETRKMAIQAENKRASADYLLQKEADALMELLESAERCHTYSQLYANQASGQGQVSDELGKEATEALAEFESAVKTKTVFLSGDEQEKVSSLLGSVRAAVASGDEHIRGRPDIAHELIDWQELMDDFQEMRNVLEELVQAHINELRK